MSEARAILEQILGALDGIASNIRNQNQSDKRSMMEIHGWNMPGMDIDDYADLVVPARDMILRILKSDELEITAIDLERLNRMPNRIHFLQSTATPNIWGGNAANSYLAINTTIEALCLLLEKYDEPDLDLKAIEDAKLLPAPQISKLKRVGKNIDALVAGTESVDNKLKAINDAHAAANELSTTLQLLNDAKSEFEDAGARIIDTHSELEKVWGDILERNNRLIEFEHDAENVLIKANTAYSAATTKGLGEAFSNRAADLSKSLWFLMALLAVALFLGACITYKRVEFVHELMKRENVNLNLLWINVTFTALSVSAPVWFAWLLSKQIGQRFRLAEDYGYKASVAKAYEGYRAEATRIDTELEKKLFATTLDMLAEPPLRLVEKESPGSPLHDAGLRAVPAFFQRRGQGATSTKMKDVEGNLE